MDFNELDIEAFVQAHPEFADWETDSIHRPPPPERFDGKRVLTGYEQLAKDRILPVPPNDSRTYDQRVLSAQVEKAMAVLPKAKADLLRRIYWEKQTQEEVAADLGISQQAVNQRLRTAEKHLRKVFDYDIEVEEEDL